MATLIRDIKKSDKPHIIRIVKDTQVFVPEEIQVAGEIMDEFFRNPEGSGYYFYVYEDDSIAIGYVCYGPTPLTKGTWDMYWLAVAPQLHGKGIGTALIGAAEQHIRSLNGRMILIETSSSANYEAARALYEKLGYTNVSIIPDFYSPGDNKVTFRKVL